MSFNKRTDTKEFMEFMEQKDIIVGLVGNPNCGKTTLFNMLTGLNQRIGNWPGVTVEKKSGFFEHAIENKHKKIEIVDLPGIYSLSAGSLDEQVSQDYILAGDADLYVNIVDATHLIRSLYLTTQLIEMKIPVIVVVNMMDLAKDKDIKIDIKKLSKKLGCPVIPMIAKKKLGIQELKDLIITSYYNTPIPKATLSYPHEIKKIMDYLLPFTKVLSLPESWVAMKWIDGDEKLLEALPSDAKDVLEQKKDELKKSGIDINITIASARYNFIKDTTRDAIALPDKEKRNITDLLDAIFLNNYIGIPFFFFAIYLVFLFSIVFSGVFIDFFDKFTGLILVDSTSFLLEQINAPKWIIAIISNGIGAGIQTVSTFIPPIGFMFIALAILEDSGYMARAALLMDKFMQMIGLPGKAVVPVIIGFGCNVPAAMATRTLENPRDRILTMMMTPFMSCGARLPIYALFSTAIFTQNGQNIVFLLYLTGIIFAVITVFILKQTILKGEITPFIIELPQYHIPTFRGVFIMAWERLKGFILKAGRIILPMVILLNFSNTMNIHGQFSSDTDADSILSSIGKAITPVFAPIGIKEENWPATVGIFTGVFAKEAVVGTLNTLYSQFEKVDNESQGIKDEFNFNEGLKDAFVSIPENFRAASGSLLDPLGFSVIKGEDINDMAEKQGVTVGVYKSIADMFDGTAGAFAYLLFLLLYFPCIGVLAAIYRETNIFWTVFAGMWTTFIAYSVSTIFYQVATFTRHPGMSTGFITGVVVIWIILLLIMNVFSKRCENSKECFRAV